MEGALPAHAMLAAEGSAFHSPRIPPPHPRRPASSRQKRCERGYSVRMEVGPSEPDAPASTAGIPAIGEVFAQKYRLERSLGRGAMGAIFAAEHVSLRQRVAVKFLLPHAMTLPGASARFLREARAAAAIRSEHVARVIDVGTAELGIPYLVMEYLRGRDLQKESEARGPLPVSEAVDYVIQGCEAVAEAHVRGIIHRDLKPGNIFLTTGATGAPIVKVLDFGLSKSAAPEDDGKLTASEMMLGSPCYMSPEQVRCSKHVDARTDIWSLGVILYQLLTARFPFEVSKISALFVAIVTQAPTPPRVHRMDLPARIEDIILRCLEKEPELRVQTVADLARELAPFGTEHSTRALAQIEAIARGKAFPSSRPLGLSGDGVASTLPAAANGGPGVSSTLPQPDAGNGAGAGPGPCSTVVAPGGGDHVITLPSQGATVVAPTSSDAPSSERRTLPIVPSEDGPTMALARNSGPTPAAGQESGPTPAAGQESGPTPAAGQESGPTPAAGQESGPTMALARNSGPTPTAGQERGPTPAAGQESGPTPAAGQESGPTLKMARDDRPASGNAPEDGPTLTMARDDGPTLTMARDDGPTLTMARDDFPTLTMARKRGAPLTRLGTGARAVPLTQPDGKEIAGSRYDGTERRDRWRSRAFRWRRTAGAWIAAATVLLAAVALGATRWLGRSDAPAAPSSPSGQGALTVASTAGHAPSGAPLQAPSDVERAAAPEALAQPPEPAVADTPSAWAIGAAATTPDPDPAAVPEHRPLAAEPPKRWRPGTIGPSRSDPHSVEDEVYGEGAKRTSGRLEPIRNQR
ncbi:protein kinase [Sorangium sp. So ce375]|uniref:serine/threonine-protein kinase n=1 Tax=Sorangium sp. So ce375 TaxID=3133306 RepID=UPI003F5B1487